MALGPLQNFGLSYDFLEAFAGLDSDTRQFLRAARGRREKCMASRLRTQDSGHRGGSRLISLLDRMKGKARRVSSQRARTEPSCTGRMETRKADFSIYLGDFKGLSLA